MNKDVAINFIPNYTDYVDITTTFYDLLSQNGLK